MPGPQDIITGLIARRLADALTPDDEEEAGRLDWSIWSPQGSTAIETVKHKLKDGTMTVRFKNRAMYPDYLFWGVPRELFKQWKRVRSAGRFYHRRIKGSYGLS